MATDQFLELFIRISHQRLYRHYLPKLLSCIHELSCTSLWNKRAPALNSTGGIVLHICEHIKRYTIRLSEPTHPGSSQGIEDHFPNLDLSPDELQQQVQEVFDEFDVTMNKLITHNPEEIDMHSLYHLVEHTGYHLGQIVDRTKMITNKPFGFCQNGINEQNLRVIINEQP